MYGFPKRVCGGLVCLTTILTRAAAQNDGIIREITTTTAGGWIQDGVMFDVGANSSQVVDSADMPDGITIMGMNILTQKEETVCVEIYSKSGSHQGFETDPLAWTFLGSVSVIGQGKDTLTPLPVRSFAFGDETFVPAGEKRSFYVTTQDQAMRYTAYPNGPHTTGSLFTSQTVPLGITSAERSVEPELNVNIYTGVANDYPFGAKWKDRMFNGNLLYTLGRDTSNIPIDPAAKAASRGKISCSKSVAPTAAPTLSIAPTDAPSAAPTLSKAPTDAPTTTVSTLKALATILAGGFLQAGNMFDVSVPSVEQGGPAGGVTVLALEVSTISTDDICVEVYSKAGTHVGSEENASDWTMLGATTTTGEGAAEATRIPLGSLDPVHIAPGERRAFYVVMPKEEMRYTKPVRDEVTGDIFTSSDEIQIHVGSVNTFDFGGFQSNRIWNGAVIYALGLKEDGKYSKLTADDRPRSCIVPGAEDTTDIDTVDATNANAGTGTDVDTATVTDGSDTTTDADSGTIATDVDSPDNTTDTNNDVNPPDATAVNPGTDEFLSGNCDAAGAISAGAFKDVKVNYKYTIITDDGTIADSVVSRMEEEIHDVMMIDKCGGGDRKMRSLQEVDPITFIGFKSAPKDVVTSEACPDIVALQEGNVCSVVQGGVTAVVPDDTNETEVEKSMSTVLQQVLSNDAIATDVGALGVAYIPSDDNDEDVSTRGDAVVAEAQGQSNTEPQGDSVLSTTEIIIIASVCGGVLLVVLLGMILVRRKRSKRADEKALFNEFPSEHGYGDIQNLAFHKSDDPLDDVPTHSNSWGSSGGKEAAQFAWQNSSSVLKEQDKSNDRSKYAPSSLFPPSSGNATSSRSRSKKNVEFVRAGRSFASNRSDQPDDTVDL
mmetsp:Transcript_16737/g.26076  ORF Transcript_16737/g.26076 Transcript_16737/m.26076 type:complete len:886 (-) Transcript_16737:1612-4269(-)